LLSNYNIKYICTTYTRIDTCLMSISRISLRDKVTLRLLKLYFYIADVAKWSRALDIRLSDWYCSVSMCSNPVEGRTQICQFIYIYIAHIVYASCGPLIGELINLWLMTYIYIYILLKLNILANRRGRDRMVVGFTATYVISGYHHWCCEFESRSRRGVEHYAIKFVSDLRQVGVFLCVLRFAPPIITDRHDIVKILLKVPFNTIKPNHLG
jgi:hypothetical protein